MTESQASNDPQVTAPDNGDPLKPMTEAEAIDSLAALLGDDDQPSADPKVTRTDKVEREASKEEDPLGPDDEEEDVATSEDDPDSLGEDSPDGSGQFVPLNGRIKMADGKTISVSELKDFADRRSKELQRDYSQKSETLASERKEVAQLRSLVSEERQFLMWFAEQNVPKQPTPPDLPATQDPIGHLEYQEKLRKYSEFVNAWQTFKHDADKENERKTGETTAESVKKAGAEVATLFSKLKIDPNTQPDKAKKFFEAVEAGAQEFYGLDANAIATLAKQDHRAILVLRDAIRARKNQKAAPQVEASLRNVPKIKHQPTARVAPNARQDQTRIATKEKLQRSGSLNDGIAAIEALLQ